MGWEISNERASERGVEGREMLVLEMKGGDSVSWGLQGLRSELRRMRECMVVAGQGER